MSTFHISGLLTMRISGELQTLLGIVGVAAICSHTYKTPQSYNLAMPTTAFVLSYLALLLLPSADCKILYVYLSTSS